MNTTPSLAERDLAALVHPHRGPGSDAVFLRGGRGCTVTDTEGREYVDCTGGGLWTSLVGHGRQELAVAAGNAMTDFGYFCSFFEYGNEKSVELGDG